MKVALICCGEGFGHVSRMVTFAQALEKEYEIFLFAPKTVHGFINSKLPGMPVEEVPHMHLVKEGDKINYWKTLVENAGTMLRFRTRIVRLAHKLSQYKIEAIINDYEPFSAFAAKKLGIPLLQINHPGIIIRNPSILPDALLTKAIAKFMMPVFDKRYFVSFYDGEIGPLIREEIKNQERKTEDYYLIYLKPSYKQPILKQLKKLGINNYKLFPNEKENYAQALAHCKGIISSAGHQSISEALYLKKPILVIPQRGQYEQRLNASMLEGTGWGKATSIRRFKKDFSAFNARINEFPLSNTKPWVRYLFADHTPRAIYKIKSFINKARGRRIIPFWDWVFSEIPEEQEYFRHDQKEM
jgi:uncharacterized protein (TIGR00661 family)